MTIKQKIFLSSIIAICISLVSVFVYFFMQNQTEKILAQDITSTKVITEINDFALIISDFAKDPYGDSQLEWLNTYDGVVSLLNSLNALDQSGEIILEGIFELMEEIRQTFSSMVLSIRYGSNIDSGYIDFDFEAALSNLTLASERLSDEVADLKQRYDLQLSDTLKKQGYILLLIISALIFVAILNSVYVFTSVAKRIGKLSNLVKDVAKTDFKIELNEKITKDEIGVLMNSINTMLSEIQLYQSDLEGKIKTRTLELTEANAKNDAILQNIGDGLVVLDKNQNITLTNPAAEVILGWSKKAMVGKNWLKLVKPSDIDGHLIESKNLPAFKVLKKDVDVASAGIENKYYYHTKSGALKPVNITASKIILAGQKVGFVIIFRDMSHEIAIDKSKSEFVSIASHQLRTPITAINWFSETLLSEKKALTKDQRELLKNIYESNQRMVSIINSLLSVASIEMGTFTIEPKKMKIKTLFDKVIKHNLNAAKKLQKKVKITHRFSSEVKELKIDSDILYICFDNLVSNAVKYTPDKDGVVNVKGYFAEKNKVIGGKKITKKSFIFEVSDNGYGIPKQEQSKIFDKLFRATNVQTHDTDGTGLGLYIVKSIVQQAGCDIWFVSAENKGTKFFISVPSTGMKMIKA